MIWARSVFVFRTENASSVVQFCLNHRVDEMIERKFAANIQQNTRETHLSIEFIEFLWKSIDFL